jgi:hypothetical protein
MATIINADTSDGLKLTSDTSGQIDFQSAGSTKATIDTSGNLKFNSGFGSVGTAYGVRAWVNFNGTGTVAIRDSGNVSSITDHGTGQYTANFTTNMPDVNYCVHLTGSVQGTTTTNGGFNTGLSRVSTPAVGSVRFETFPFSGFADPLQANVSIVR